MICHFIVEIGQAFSHCPLPEGSMYFLCFHVPMLQNPLMTKRRHFSLCGIFMCLLGFAAHTRAEDQPYSADSLVATFKKGSNVSVKGTAITLSGVVIEVKKSSVVFKSSENDKVICEF